MPNRLKQSHSDTKKSGKEPKRIWSLFKYSAYLAGLVVVVMVVSQLIYMVRLTAGITKEKPVATQLITVEIINASGVPGISKNVSALLDDVNNSEIEIAFLEAERLQYKDIEKSLVISRNKETDAAKYVAEIVGINKSKVVYRPAFENDMSPSVTLVLGEDIQEILNSQNSKQGEEAK